MPVAAPRKNEKSAAQRPTSFQLVEASGCGRLRKPSTSFQLVEHFPQEGNVMKVGILSLALIVVAFAGAPGNLASATRISYAQTQQPRNQTQSQEGLSPDQKKKISSYDPTDVFGVTGQDPPRQTGKQRKPLPTPVPPSTAPQRQPATSAGAPSVQPSATPVQSPAAEPSPTAVAGPVDNGLQSPPLGQVGSSDRIFPKWATPVSLIGLALAVLAALTWTLTKLVEKIREGSSG